MTLQSKRVTSPVTLSLSSFGSPRLPALYPVDIETPREECELRENGLTAIKLRTILLDSGKLSRTVVRFDYRHCPFKLGVLLNKLPQSLRQGL